MHRARLVNEDCNSHVREVLGQLDLAEELPVRSVSILGLNGPSEGTMAFHTAASQFLQEGNDAPLCLYRIRFYYFQDTFILVYIRSRWFVRTADKDRAPTVRGCLACKVKIVCILIIQSGLNCLLHPVFCGLLCDLGAHLAKHGFCAHLVIAFRFCFVRRIHPSMRGNRLII